MYFFRVNHTVRHLGWFLLASYGTWDFALKFKCDDTKELKHSRDIVILYLIFICFEGELWLSVFIKLFMLSEGTSKVQISEVSKLISWIYAINPIKFELVIVSSFFFETVYFANIARRAKSKYVQAMKVRSADLHRHCFRVNLN